MSEGKKTPVWALRPQQRPVKLMCHITNFGNENWAERGDGERPLLLDHDAFTTREAAAERTRELVQLDIAALRKRLVKLERLLTTL